MTNEQTKSLALNLLRADTEELVIDLLTGRGYWDDPRVWRLYGDRDGNFATIGNQQSRPEAALGEKIVNAVDARLMNECLVRGIDPAAEAAPPTMRHAVTRFFEKREPQGEIGGTLQTWSQDKQLAEAQFITLAVTGPTGSARTGSPSLTIADLGEGQTPARMPETFLSIDRTNKLRIKFVQGKFNMGGTGALKFCGQHSLQLIITKRNPTIVAAMHETDSTASRWGFTIVRRERPKPGVGQVRNSVYRYLAPVRAEQNPGRGDVLSFEAPEMPMMPVNNRAYVRSMLSGSVVKLYEYEMKGFRSHVLMKGGLLNRLELLLPGVGLPIRVHECRDFKGDQARSFANSLVGLISRLETNRGDNLEPDYPTSVSFVVRGEPMIAQIYAFKGDRADSYRTNEGIIFAVNGQTHGAIPKTFFERSKVKMSRLARSLLVIVDCSALSDGAREDFFMNSKDRLSGGALRKAIEEELEDLISRHPGLRALRERRRNEEIAERLEDSRPLEDVLGSILKSSPSLARLFLLGQRLSRPHRLGGNGNGGGGGPDEGAGEFQGRAHPTFFRFYGRRTGENLVRTAELSRRCRIRFETDVVNEYFTRPSLPGHYHVEVLEGPIEGADVDHNLTMHNGIANWSINLPEDALSEGDKLTLQCTVTDDVIPEPLVNIAQIQVVGQADHPVGAPGQRRSRHGNGGKGHGGIGSGGEGGQEGPSEAGGIKLPDIVRVKANSEIWIRYHFDDTTACKIVEDAAGDGERERSVYTFYVNVDNRYLRTDMKGSDDDVALKEAKFVFGNVLVGLALIHDHRSGSAPACPEGDDANGEEQSIEAHVEHTTRAIAPFLVPMIDYLGALTGDQVTSLAQVGDDE